jgi:hypothetical protein
MLKGVKVLLDKIKTITKKEYKPLGRWNIDYCNKKINKKIDLSNEDHCGPCGQYIINKKNLLYSKKPETNIIEKSHIQIHNQTHY